jgi:hypothetical protein
MSSNSTNVSDIFNQRQLPLCWMYSSANVCLKFVTQLFYCYHSERQFFEGKGKGREKKEDSNYYIELRDSIKGKDFNPQSGTDRRRLLFVYFCGIALKCFMNSNDVSRIAYNGGDMARKKRMQLETKEGFWPVVPINSILQHLKKFNIEECKHIFKYYIFNNNKACFSTICDIALFSQEYINNYNITPTGIIWQDTATAHIVIKKILNQNIYFEITVDYFKKSQCAECIDALKPDIENVVPFVYNGVNRMQTPTTNTHSMTCIGYDKEKHALIIKNSYDVDWCETGFFYLKDLDCINLCILTFIDSKLPQYNYLNKKQELFKPGKVRGSNSSSSSSIWHVRPTVIKSVKEMTSRYGIEKRVAKRHSNATSYYAIKYGLSIPKTKKRCPAGYKVDKRDKSICNKK